MISFKEYEKDAKRYRALRHTEKAAPWYNVLGAHQSLDSLSDALISVIQTEDAPANSGFGGPGLAKYDPMLGGKKKKMIRRRQPNAGMPLTNVPRLRGMEI